MAKTRRLNKKKVLIFSIISFFIFYWGGFKLTEFFSGEHDIKTEEPIEKEDEKSIMGQLGSNDKIYISDDKVQDVKVEENYWEKIKFFADEFQSVREPSGYEPIYEGYSEEGIRFSTDLNYFRVYNVNKEEYYKVPISKKNDFKKLIEESIYTSFDSIKQYKTWNKVTIINGEKSKRLSKFKFDDLSYKMVPKRIVGKVQPEKSKERSEYNFAIDIKGENYSVVIELMGQEYVKIVSGDLVSYYEVHTGLYDYIKNEVFKIKE